MVAQWLPVSLRATVLWHGLEVGVKKYQCMEKVDFLSHHHTPPPPTQIDHCNRNHDLKQTQKVTPPPHTHNKPMPGSGETKGRDNHLKRSFAGKNLVDGRCIDHRPSELGVPRTIKSDARITVAGPSREPLLVKASVTGCGGGVPRNYRKSRCGDGLPFPAPAAPSLQGGGAWSEHSKYIKDKK